MENERNIPPDYAVKSVVDVFDREGRPVLDKKTGRQKSRWREVGVAFCSKKTDTITILLDALPIGGKMVLTRIELQQESPKQGGFMHPDVA